MRAFVITLAGTVGGAALAVAGILVMAQRGEKPSELNADVWGADPDIRAANLAAKTAAWKAGESWISPTELARLDAAHAHSWMAEGVTAMAPPEPERRLVRDRSMRPPRGK